MRLSAWVVAGCLLSAGCQCFEPVREVDPELSLDASTPEAFLSSLLPDLVCGQAIACDTLSSHVTCAELLNEPGSHYAPTWTAQVAAALDAGAVIYDVAEGQRCLERLRTECGLTSCSRDALRGQRAAGELCALTMECRAGLYCGGPALTCPRCVPFLEEGAETSEQGACRDGSASLQDGGLRCHTRRGAGEPCALAPDEASWWNPCAPGLACVRGVCSTPLTEGGVCTDGACVPSLVCTTDAGCVARAEVGERCGACRQGLECREGVCALRRPEGAACRFSWDCRAPNGCLAGACRPLGGVGASCSTVMDCLSPLPCVSGACRALRGVDESCASTALCASGLACEFGRCQLQRCR